MDRDVRYWTTPRGVLINGLMVTFATVVSIYLIVVGDWMFGLGGLAAMIAWGYLPAVRAYRSRVFWGGHRGGRDDGPDMSDVSDEPLLHPAPPEMNRARYSKSRSKVRSSRSIATRWRVLGAAAIVAVALLNTGIPLLAVAAVSLVVAAGAAALEFRR